MDIGVRKRCYIPLWLCYGHMVLMYVCVSNISHAYEWKPVMPAYGRYNGVIHTGGFTKCLFCTEVLDCCHAYEWNTVISAVRKVQRGIYVRKGSSTLVSVTWYFILFFCITFRIFLYLVSVTRYSLSVLVRNGRAGADVPMQSVCILRDECR